MTTYFYRNNQHLGFTEIGKPPETGDQTSISGKKYLVTGIYIDKSEFGVSFRRAEVEPVALSNEVE